MSELIEPFYFTLFYSIQNCGDGSAYPKYFASEELARFDQDHMDEGWGEACHGNMVFKSDCPIVCAEEITTVDDMIKDREDDIANNIRYAIMSDAREERTGKTSSYGSAKYLASNEGLNKQLIKLKEIKGGDKVDG